MSLLSDSQWARLSVLCVDLAELSETERAAKLNAMRAEGEDDSHVLSLVALHFAMPPEPDRVRTGENIGAFTLGPRIGAGGMGVVYQAEQQLGQIARQVAVKLIHPSLLLADRGDMLARFEAELETLVVLEYEGIVRIYDGGIHVDGKTQDPTPYIAMQLVQDGQSITDFACTHNLSVAERLMLMRRVCTALHRAHAHHILHRDLKPSNILIDRHGQSFIIDFGLAQAFDTLLPSGYQLCKSGTPAYMSPEQFSTTYGPVTDKSDVYALGVVLYELLTGQLPYHIPRGTPFEALSKLIIGTIPPPHPMLSDDLYTLIRDSLNKYSDRRLSLQALGQRIDAYLGISPVKVPGADFTEVPESCPYRGLEPFHVKHAPFFFGRESLIERLLDILRPATKPDSAHRFVTLMGPSGSGKSSLARAGLFAALQRGELEASQQWSYLICTPGTKPLSSLVEVLESEPLIQAQLDGGRSLLDRLFQDQRTLHQAIHLALRHAPSSHRVVLLVDPFEELYTHCEDETERQAFLANLLYAAQCTGGQTIVIVVLLTDAYAQCSTHPALAAALSDYRVVVGPMEKDNLRQAIERPAQLLNRGIDPGLLETLIYESGQQADRLPLLQDVLRELWEQYPEQPLSQTAYEAIGGIAGGLEQRAEEMFRQFKTTEQAVCQRLFMRLSQAGNTGYPILHRVPLTEFIAAEADTERASLVVEQLVRTRLVTLSSSEGSTIDDTIELAHAALIQHWERLEAWITVSRDTLDEPVLSSVDQPQEAQGQPAPANAPNRFSRRRSVATAGGIVILLFAIIALLAYSGFV